MHDGRVAKRYAKALFETALRFDMVQAVEDDLQVIERLMETDQGFRDFLLQPYTNREEKTRVIDRIFSDRVTALTLQAFRLMLEKRRESELAFVRDEYARLRRSHAGIVLAEVISAIPLSPDQQTRLVAKLSTVLGRQVEAEYRIDPTLIGGIKVAYENNVLDGSVRGTLDKLRERLRYDLLKQS